MLAPVADYGRWSRALVCQLRGNTSWSEIGICIAKAISVKGMVAITMLQPNKGIFFVETEKIADDLLRRGPLETNSGVTVDIQKWSPSINEVV